MSHANSNRNPKKWVLIALYASKDSDFYDNVKCIQFIKFKNTHKKLLYRENLSGLENGDIIHAKGEKSRWLLYKTVRGHIL